ncbi:MAG: hypothetical protein ACUVQ5_05560 [Candidatus Methanomethylicaceae archaeon]
MSPKMELESYSTKQKIGETKKKSAYVAEQILNAIRHGQYKIGDRLPRRGSLLNRWM